MVLISALMLSHHTLSNANEPCQGWAAWSKSSCQRIHQIFSEGHTDLYLTGYAWHNRYTYPKEKIKRYNEAAWGFGFGKGLHDEKGNWHGLMAFGFLDSHSKVEPAAGYAYLKMLRLSENTELGLGLSLFLTMRSDIFNGVPFGGILPWLSYTYRRATISATYIPGAFGAGNVLFVLTKWQL